MNEMNSNFREAAKKTADFVQLASPSGEVIARHIRELVACDDPIAESERRMRLSVLVARFATAAALALALIERNGLSLVDPEFAAGELADAGIALSKASQVEDVSGELFGLESAHALITALIPEGHP